MATRSTISIKENGKIRTIYAHWDGYPSHNGAILLQHYITSEKVNELIDLGDISILAENTKPLNEEPHSFDAPQKNVVVAYGRDRGDKDTEARIYTESEGCKERQEYDYLFENGEWKVRFSGSEKFFKLTKKICELD